MIDKVADALEQAFEDRVAASASAPGKPVTFEETGVIAPRADVWQAYARAAMLAMWEPTYEMKFLHAQPAWPEDAKKLWQSMLYEALK